jgi:hypothetical protein
MKKFFQYWWYMLTLPKNGSFALSGPDGYFRYCSTTGCAQYTDNKWDCESVAGKSDALLYFKHMDFTTIQWYKNYREFCNGFRTVNV